MKTKLWMLGMAIAALTSCTQSEVVDMPKVRAIGFNSFVEKSTRALTVTTQNNLEKIYVFGYEKHDHEDATNFDTEPLFFHTPVEKSSTEVNKWNYNGHKHWQRHHTYRFAAYSTGDAGNTALTNIASYDPDNDKVSFTNYTPNNDLIVAISGDRKVEGTIPSDRVSFGFYHMLSRVKISFKLGTAFNATVKIRNIKIVNAIANGNGTYSYVPNGANGIEWDGTPTGVNLVAYTLLSDAETKELTTDFLEFELFVIPQSTANIKVQFDYSTYEKNGNNTESIHDYNKEAPLTLSENITQGEWLPGYIYNYVCAFGSELDETPIEFIVTAVDGWETGNENAVVLTPTDITNQSENQGSSGENS